MAVDQDTDTLFVAPGNPGPDFVRKERSGKNLYTNSLVALDISGEKPRIKWYYQILENDTHDSDPAMIPVLFDGQIGGQTRPLVAIGDKAGNFVLLDRNTGQVVHRLALSKQVGLDIQQSRDGTEACPNHGGGIEWNGGAYDPNSNSFLVPSTEECGIWKISTDDPQYIPGQPYTGGPFPRRQKGTGVLTSIDVSTGKLRWRNALPYPAQGGVLITKTGLAFTSDVGGNIYAFDAASGHQYWSDVTGSAVVGPISAYSVNGAEYLAVVVGEAGNQQTPNLPASEGSYVIVFGLGSAPTIVNDRERRRRSLQIADGKVDKRTYNGFRRYNAGCNHCRGPDGVGSSFGPSLIEAPMMIEDFRATVLAGRANGNFVMKGFADDPNVAPFVDEIYAYLRGRTDGVIGRGRPLKADER